MPRLIFPHRNILLVISRYLLILKFRSSHCFNNPNFVAHVKLTFLLKSGSYQFLIKYKCASVGFQFLIKKLSQVNNLGERHLLI